MNKGKNDIFAITCIKKYTFYFYLGPQKIQKISYKKDWTELFEVNIIYPIIGRCDELFGSSLRKCVLQIPLIFSRSIWQIPLGIRILGFDILSKFVGLFFWIWVEEFCDCIVCAFGIIIRSSSEWESLFSLWEFSKKFCVVRCPQWVFSTRTVFGLGNQRAVH